MQFKNAIVFGLLGGAFAQTLGVIQAEFGKIGAALDGLDSAVKALTDGGDAAAQTKSTVAKSSAVEEAIKAATSAIKGSSAKLSLLDATGVSTAANTLISKTDTTISDLIAKKAIIVKYNQGGETKTQLTAQKAAADALAGAIVEKMPAAAQSIAKGQAAKVGTAIGKGLAAFS
jgi:hypothetical protein